MNLKSGFIYNLNFSTNIRSGTSITFGAQEKSGCKTGSAPQGFREKFQSVPEADRESVVRRTLVNVDSH